MSYAEKLLAMLMKYFHPDVGKIVLEYLPEWGCVYQWSDEFIGVRSITGIAGGRILLVDSDNVPKIFDYEGKELDRWDYDVNVFVQVSAIDGGRQVALVSHKNQLVTIIDSDGKELRGWSDHVRLACPCGSADIGNGRIAVVEQCNHRVNVYTEEGKFLYRFDHGEGDFRHPTIVARITDDRVAIVDDNHSRIQIFVEGRFIQEWDDPALEYLLIGRVSRFGEDCVAIFDFRDRQTLIVDARSGKFLYRLKDLDDIFVSLQDLFVVDENRLLAIDCQDRPLLLERLR